jgi:hypothetical protein
VAHKSGEWDRALKHARERLQWNQEHGYYGVARAIREELNAYDEGDRTDVLLLSLQRWR